MFHRLPGPEPWIYAGLALLQALRRIMFPGNTSRLRRGCDIPLPPLRAQLLTLNDCG